MQDPKPQPQHLDALARANTVRRRRYAIRRAIRTRRLSVCSLFTERGLPARDRELIAHLDLAELLSWGYRIGDAVTVRVLAATGGPGRKRLEKSTKLAALSRPRLEVLVEALEQTAPDACTGFATLDELVAASGTESLEAALEVTTAHRAAA